MSQILGQVSDPGQTLTACSCEIVHTGHFDDTYRDPTVVCNLGAVVQANTLPAKTLGACRPVRQQAIPERRYFDERRCACENVPARSIPRQMQDWFPAEMPFNECNLCL